MCEMLALQSAEPFRLEEALQLALQLERYGIAGFGWGMAWVAEGHLKGYQSAGSLAEDVAQREALAVESATSCLVHLRRPSFLSTISVANSQPYLCADEFAFGHNGYLANHNHWRAALNHLLVGQSDSEVAFHLYAQRTSTGDRCQALASSIQDTIGDGEANVVALHRDETLVAAGQNGRNPMYQFRGRNFTGIVTGLHSLDTYIFDHVFPWMKDVVQITACTAIASTAQINS